MKLESCSRSGGGGRGHGRGCGRGHGRGRGGVVQSPSQSALLSGKTPAEEE